ncbi:MAG: glycosyltransferase family 2 protein [Anaerolineae bacterium]|jgi:glycosyltransferase involved in cell wall biosynthesis
MSETQMVSFVLPFYNEEHTLGPLYAQIRQVLEDHHLSYELLFVDDGSSDGSAALVAEISRRDAAVSLLRLRGNYGKSAALAAGFDHVQGQLVFTMDTDLQDDPVEIPRFLAKIAEGYDLVGGYKRVRHDPWIKVLSSRLFNCLVRLMTGIPLRDVNCGFKCYRRCVIDELRGTIRGELHRLLPVLAHWKRFRISEIEVQHHPRRYGKSNFGLRRMFSGVTDLITVSFLLRYRVKPSHLFGQIGAMLGLVGTIICAYLAVLWFQGVRPIGDRPLLILGVLLIIVGVQFFGSGLLAELLVYSTQRQEPPYGLVIDADTGMAEWLHDA